MVTVIGLGFVGLTTALGFCSKGFKVFGYDYDSSKTDLINKGKVPFFEPYLEEVLNKNLNSNFYIVKDLADAIKESDVVFICVGTPCKADGSADFKYIYSALEASLKEMKKKDYKVIVIKSTVPPSSTEEKIKPFIHSLGFEVGKDVGLANNPEFLREGYAWEDFVKPDRIVIGQSDSRSGSIVENYYKPFQSPIYKVSLNTAEYIKYLSNTLLSTLISFSNEQSLIANSIGDIDIKKSFEVLHMDKRWNGRPAGMSKYIYPGCGFGGYCLPKDTLALYTLSKQKGYTPNLFKNVLDINQQIKSFVVQKVCDTVQPSETIGILGLSFKPNSDDVRDTPANDIIKKLLVNGYTNIIAYDPLAIDSFKKEYNYPIHYAPSTSELIDLADHIIILTAWKEFIENKEILTRKNIYDFRYIF
ncbi:UDP-glucose dehydrogenase family protein [Bacillus sp. Marseille-P3661]|uniref:UDP-glucose dehydrogenase family protein n=1 Tax=Bacillus sp. Marseille-P3661 TaxID=1936234 RepID=UPI000C81A4BB|nr:UDP-glucose/GDP-mannose dehydrogenase family protein [Bacillus sp. Marseille-P3661]